MMGYYGEDAGFASFGMVFLMMLMALFFVGFIWFLVWVINSMNRMEVREKDPVMILKERYARGEITEKDYERMIETLEE